MSVQNLHRSSTTGSSGHSRCVALVVAVCTSATSSNTCLSNHPCVHSWWCRKDTAKSDPMDEACDMVELPWIYRKAILVLNKLEVRECT
jgi:hypothetical protein